MTGEIIAEAGEVLTRERAEEIAEAGVNDVYLDVDGKSIRVFGNGMVDMKHYVDFDPAELGVKELVRGVILRQLMEQYEGDALKEAIEENLPPVQKLRLVQQLAQAHLPRDRIAASCFADGQVAFI